MEILTPEQSENVQKILFKNGYCWASGKFDIIHTDKKYLTLRELSSDIDSIFLFYNNYYSNDHDVPLISYNDFDTMYGLKAERRMKLKILINEY